MTLPKSLTTVTTCSKILAGVLFITLPFLGFYLGMEYEKTIFLDVSEVSSPIVRTTTKPSIDPTTNWKTYVNEKLGIKFKYPDHLIEPEEEDGKVILIHSISLEHPDPCDAKGIGLIKKDIEDLKVVFEVINKNLIETVIGNSGDYFQENYIKDNKIKLESGFIDESNHGLLKGYRVTDGVEGCGNYTFYFPMSAQKTLLIKRQFVPELNPIIVNYKENLKIPGIIPPKTEEQLFDQILSTFKFLDQNASTRVVKLFYHDLKLDPKTDLCEANNFIEKEIPLSQTLIQDTINLLIKDPIFAQHPDFKLLSSSLQNGVLYLEFPEIGGFTTGGSCRISILTSQIVKTATQFPEVKEVKFEPEVFQP